MLCPEESCKVVTDIVFRPANSPVVLAITGPTVVPSVTRKVVVTFYNTFAFIAFGYRQCSSLYVGSCKLSVTIGVINLIEDKKQRTAVSASI